MRRKAGRHYDAFSKRFKHEHTFMLKDVPGFSFIMIHLGNTTADTLGGCLLVGLGALLNDEQHYELRGSASAYGQVSATLTALTANGQRAYLHVERTPRPY